MDGGAGSFLARYTAEGNLDTSFGDGGKLMDRSYAIWDLVVQADGHIVVLTPYGLIRFSPDGTHHESFGNDSQLPIRAQMHWLAQQSDGRIIAAGEESASPSEAFVLIRFRGDGSLDPTFGTAGVVTTEMPGGSMVTEVAVMADARIQVLGLIEWTRKSGYSRLALVRYHTDGSLDTSFAEGGKAATDFGSPYVFPRFAVQPDGHIVVADTKLFNPTDDFEMIRFNPNGSLDLSFGYAGVARTDFSGRQDSIKALVAVGNDRIVAAGPSRGAGDSCFALACYMTTGTPHEPDFELGFSSSVIRGTRGTRTTIAVNLHRIGGFSGDVTVTPPDLPAEGIICKAPEPAIVSGTTASWKFKIKGRAAPGPHQLTFIGRDASGRERSATVTLFVD